MNQLPNLRNNVTPIPPQLGRHKTPTPQEAVMCAMMCAALNGERLMTPKLEYSLAYLEAIVQCLPYYGYKIVEA
jgi:hypothetical protein